jgi:PAS domain S-box-containing protein
VTHEGDGFLSELEARVRFEALLAELSSRFVNLPPVEVDREIFDAHRRICECLDIDISALWQWSVESPRDFTMTHVYRALEGPPLPDPMDAREYFPWCLDEVDAGRIVAVASVDELPVQAARDKETFRYVGARNALVFPLAAGGGPVIGALAFNSVREAHGWSEEIVQRLQLVAQVFANALVRRRADATLRESEERLQLAAESAEIGLWMLDVGSGRFWVNERGRALFGYAVGSDVTMTRILESVLPADRQTVENVVREAAETGESMQVDYRIVLPGGHVRWLHSRGRLWPATAEKPARLLGTSLDVTERRQAEELQAEQLRFETMLGDLSAQFVNLPAGQVDAVIEDALRRVSECLDLDLAGLWQWVPDDSGSHAVTHIFRRLPGLPVPHLMDVREHFPWCLEQVTAGRPVDLTSIEDAPPEAARDLEVWRHFGVKSDLTIPLAAGGGPIIGALSLNTLESERPWPEALVKRIRLVAEVFANALERKHSEERLSRSFAEVTRLQAQLELENRYLQKEHDLLHGHGRIVGESPALLKVLGLAEQVAQTRTTVLIEGETGSGKELIARRIHELSPRRDRAMVKVNCAALPSTLVESELFGREKGAYTGAVSREPGRFEVANGSTIFLDEVAELPLELQAKLLRVLEQGEFERVGSSRTQQTDVRVIAATNRNLGAEVEAGRFRRDLFFRLAVFPIRVPPLRERRQDVPLLVWSAVGELSAAMNKSVESIRRHDLERLQRYDWPGNVRELRNLVERALILCHGPVLSIEPPLEATPGGEANLSLDEGQRRQIQKALEASGGRVSGPGGAAELLGLKPTTLRSKMERLGIAPRRA